MNDLANFTAEAARLLAESKNKQDAEPILKAIHDKANQGLKEVDWYHIIKQETISELKERGFKISGGGYDRDGICYTISW